MAPRAPGSSEDPLFRAFRQRVRDTVVQDLERERLEAERLRAAVLPRLQEAIAQARGRSELCEAWLFGSFAWGQPTERSDVDVLVKGCRDPDSLAGQLWRACGRPAHVVDFAAAPPGLVQRVTAEGLPL